jgi:hypothetical protein
MNMIPMMSWMMWVGVIFMVRFEGLAAKAFEDEDDFWGEWGLGESAVSALFDVRSDDVGDSSSVVGAFADPVGVSSVLGDPPCSWSRSGGVCFW